MMIFKYSGIALIFTFLGFLTVPTSLYAQENVWIAAGPASAPGTSYNFYRNLGLGSRGSEVVALQERLKEEGFFPKHVSVTGYFGPVTQKAVIEFQRSHSLPTTGYVGPLTRDILNTHNIDNTPIAEARTMITVNGTIVCLPSKGRDGSMTLECAMGLQSKDGKHYALKNLNQQDIVEGKIVVGDLVRVSGLFTSGAVEIYDVVGAIEVESITHISN